MNDIIFPQSVQRKADFVLRTTNHKKYKIKLLHSLTDGDTYQAQKITKHFFIIVVNTDAPSILKLYALILNVIRYMDFSTYSQVDFRLISGIIALHWVGSKRNLWPS